MVASRIVHQNFTNRFVNLTLYYCLSFSSLALAYLAIRSLNTFDYYDIPSIVYTIFGVLLFGLAIYYFFKSIYSVTQDESCEYKVEWSGSKNSVGLSPKFKLSFLVKNLQVIIGLISLTWIVLTLSFFGDFSYFNTVWYFAGFTLSHTLLLIQSKTSKAILI